VVFTDSPDKRFQEFDDSEFVKIDTNLGIKYEKDEILEDTVLLLRYNCPDKDCDAACLGWPDLHRHVRSKHNKTMCDLCTRNKKVFTHEHELFTFGELRKHERYGDDNPGAIDQSGFKGHPECGFCRQRFYGDDELYTHCREKHERCHICDRRNGGRNPQYYMNYQELEKHFAAEHFVCLDAECQANKTNVFESEMDLKAHQLAEHPNGLSKDARRDARVVNLSGFDQLRQPYQPQRGGRREREGRGNGRGRDPNADPLPMSTAQPQTRAELAFQRQMAIQSSQSVSNRTFGGQLTQSAQPSRAAGPALVSPRPQQANLVPGMESLIVDPADLTPQERARQLRHQAVTERATQLLKNNATKLSQFRAYVSDFRTDKTTAQDILESFFSLFDCSPSDLGKLIRELADLYEDETKRHSLLEAWNSWRSINEDYPSLPGPSSGGLGGSSGASGATSYASATTSTSSKNLAASLGANITSGRRVLKLKSSTAQSRNAAVTNSAAARVLANPEAFPALSASRNLARQGHHLPTWSASQSQVTSTHLSIAPRPTTATASTTSKKASLPPTMNQRQNESMFPSLPKTAKPNVMISGFNTRATGRFSGQNSGASTPKPSPWAAAPTPGEAQAALTAVAGTSAGHDGTVIDAEASKTKRGKKKGQTINLRDLMS
jgi:E3 ubiquitin-protein ligase ZNF598